MAGCLIRARLWLLGLDVLGRPLWRHDAAIRVDGAMVAQIGAFAAVSYGVDLPIYGDAGGVALPLFAPPSALAARFGGLAGRLTPRSPAHLAVFTGPAAPTRAALRAAAFSAAPEGVAIFLDGQPADPDVLSAWRRSLEAPETAGEAALWAALATAGGSAFTPPEGAAKLGFTQAEQLPVQEAQE